MDSLFKISFEKTHNWFCILETCLVPFFTVLYEQTGIWSSLFVREIVDTGKSSCVWLYKTVGSTVHRCTSTFCAVLFIRASHGSVLRLDCCTDLAGVKRSAWCAVASCSSWTVCAAWAASPSRAPVRSRPRSRRWPPWPGLPSRCSPTAV